MNIQRISAAYCIRIGDKENLTRIQRRENNWLNHDVLLNFMAHAIKPTKMKDLSEICYRNRKKVLICFVLLSFVCFD